MKKYNDSVEISNLANEIRKHKKHKRNLILGALALLAVGCVYGVAKYHEKNKNILIVDDADAWDILFMQQASKG